MPIMRAAAAVQGGLANSGGNSAVQRRANENRENRRSTFTAENRKSKASMSSSNINNNNRSSIASYGTQVKVKTSFYISRRKDDTPACFKFDGDRFKSEQTLKLLSSVDYLVRMEIEPNMELLYIKFAGIENSFTLVNDPEKDNKSVYQFFWSTKGIDPTLSRHRTDVLCAMKFKNYKEIDFRFQVKFYTAKLIKHAKFGETLNNISMNCTVGRGTYTSYVDDMKLS